MRLAILTAAFAFVAAPAFAQTAVEPASEAATMSDTAPVTEVGSAAASTPAVTVTPSDVRATEFSRPASYGGWGCSSAKAQPTS